MAGPVAPKDPGEKRPGFYVLLDKQVGGIPQDDGRGVHSIFIRSDRLPSAARVTGGVEDETILKLLTDVVGFRKLVHSIGVSISAQDPTMEVGFSLICKGNGGPGSCHRFTFPADGAERVITLDRLDWSEFDAGLGEFRFEFPSVADMATASVKCYVNDGFQIPEVDPDPAVETEGYRYREMIARSFLSAGNNARVQSFLRRARAGEAVTVAFLEGSITQGAGAVPLQENCYARVCWEGLRRKYGTNIRYIKAGVGGTPSETGLMRSDRDITREGRVQPDLVVVEFAVNDAGDETEGVFYESLVRHILNGPGRPAVILLFAVFADDWNLKRRLAPIGYRHQLPMVDVLADAVAPFGGKIIWRCFVYNCRQDWRDAKTDRARAAYDNFMAVDGQFRDNVILQIKNGPMDFQVREPVAPLFGGLKHTNMMIEFQIAQEYTGQQRHVCYLMPWFRQVLEQDMYVPGVPSKVSDLVSGRSYGNRNCGMAAVANTGNDFNWTGHDLAAANWYGFGRLAYDMTADPEELAREWVQLTFGSNAKVVDTLTGILMDSWPAYEKYTSPLGIGWMVTPSNYYGPSVDGYEYDRWGTYHRANHRGVGVERGRTGTGYCGQYNEPLCSLYENVDTCPDELVLFFHHLPYTHVLKSGKTVIQHIYDTHFEGAGMAEGFLAKLESIRDLLPEDAYERMHQRLEHQAEHSKDWRDIINTYFHRISDIDDEKGRTIYD